MQYGVERDRFRAHMIPQRLLDRARHEQRRLSAPISRRLTPLRHQSFEAWDERHAYFVHPYNMTWRNERAVEVPLALSFLSRVEGYGMEFGNVLSHYGESKASVVVDKYEIADGVSNVDIVDYRPDTLFDFIVSVSTLEHVGWDESPRSETKVLDAFDCLRAMLRPSGKMFISAPLGHNAALDAAVLEGRWHAAREFTMVRNSDGTWSESETIERREYGGDGYAWARSVWFAEFG